MDRLIAALRTLAAERECPGGCVNGQQPMSLCQTCSGTGPIPGDSGAAHALEVLTKRCPNHLGWDKDIRDYRDFIMPDCHQCDGTGRIPRAGDVGALLRAARALGYTENHSWLLDDRYEHAGQIRHSIYHEGASHYFADGPSDDAALLAALTAAVDARCKEGQGG